MLGLVAGDRGMDSRLRGKDMGGAQPGMVNGGSILPSRGRGGNDGWGGLNSRRRPAPSNVIPAEAGIHRVEWDTRVRWYRMRIAIQPPSILN